MTFRILTDLELQRDLAKAAGESAFAARVDAFICAVQAKTDAYTRATFPNLEPDTISVPRPWGPKYIRVLRESRGRGSVHCFIDRRNGDILKAAGYSNPAKHARGNIFASDYGMSGMGDYGPKYLR